MKEKQDYIFCIIKNGKNAQRLNEIHIYIYAQSRSYFHSPGIFDSCETSLAR